MNKIDDLIEGMRVELTGAGSISDKMRQTYNDSKNYVNPNSVDNEGEGDSSLDESKTVTKTFRDFLDKKELDEANIEIKDPNAKVITVDGKPYTNGFGNLKADYPKHFAALRSKLKADGKTMANFGGNNSAVDIVAKADGTIVVSYDA